MWVVYAGEEPVSAHPAVPVPLAALVERADLSQRMRPEEVPAVKDRVAAVKDSAAATARKVVKRHR
ncbi:MAG: hypothetical protein IPM08_07275 [Actinomycetales bacterium]|nr:hypothetical protein [Actinomycetales bacterium]